jgi:hypothetical protein
MNEHQNIVRGAILVLLTFLFVVSKIYRLELGRMFVV